MPVPHSEQILAALDSEGHETGDTFRRDELKRLGYNYATAHLLTTFQGQLLRQLVSVRPPVWGSTVAAFVLAGETATDAVLRRGREELKRDMRKIAPLRYAGTLTMPGLGGGTKFVNVFRQEVRASLWASMYPYGVDLTGDVEAVSLLDCEDVWKQVAEHPRRYTETFRVIAEYLQGEGRGR